LNVILRRSEVPLAIPDAETAVREILTPLLRVHSSPALLTEGLHLYRRYSLSWYDSLILAAALEGGCKTLYSEDFQPGLRIGNLTVVNPFARG
jgi:predicted nucleic acid-binding protein